MSPREVRLLPRKVVVLLKLSVFWLLLLKPTVAVKLSPMFLSSALAF